MIAENLPIARGPHISEINGPRVAPTSREARMKRATDRINGETETDMEAVVMPNPDEVPRSIVELGMTVELLVDAVRRGQTYADFGTASYSPTYAGTIAYHETVAGLRESLGVLGWSLLDDENIARSVSPDGSVVITAVSGNERTGLREGEHAQTKRPRGKAGLRIVRRNAQLVLVDLLPPDDKELNDEPVNLGPMWYLLYYRDKDKVRSELSLADGVTEKGNLLHWRERLPLPEIDLNEPSPESGQHPVGNEPDVDVPVERRTG